MLRGCCERAFGLRALLFSIQWAEVLRSLWLGRGAFQKCQAFRKKHRFSSHQGSVLKFENFAVIRRMNYFSASLGFPPCAQAAGHSPSRPPHRAQRRERGERESCLPRPGPPHTRPGTHTEAG